jgi:hypothetical protein
MASRAETKTPAIAQDPEELTPKIFGHRKKPESGRFCLQVDRQTKASYTTLKAAEEAGLAIKKAYPFLRVAVHDATEGVNKIIELPRP